MSNSEELKTTIILHELEKIRNDLYKNRQVPLHELQILVFSTYACGMISAGKSSEILSISICEFLDLFDEWMNANPRMRKIHYFVQDELAVEDDE